MSENSIWNYLEKYTEYIGKECRVSVGDEFILHSILIDEEDVWFVGLDGTMWSAVFGLELVEEDKDEV